jgi:hypothetical protein
MNTLWGLKTSEWIAFVATTVALVSVCVSLLLGYKQRALQIRLALFDKRFAVYRAVGEFIVCILKANGTFDLTVEFRRFQDSMEQAKFLFPRKSKVVPYLTEIRDKAMKLWPLCVKRDRDAEAGIVLPNPEIFDLLANLSGPVLQKRDDVFSEDLQVAMG